MYLLCLRKLSKGLGCESLHSPLCKHHNSRILALKVQTHVTTKVGIAPKFVPISYMVL